MRPRATAMVTFNRLASSDFDPPPTRVAWAAAGKARGDNLLTAVLAALSARWAAGFSAGA